MHMLFIESNAPSYSAKLCLLLLEMENKISCVVHPRHNNVTGSVVNGASILGTSAIRCIIALLSGIDVRGFCTREPVM